MGVLAGDVKVVVELSPTMVPWAIERCIAFEFYQDCFHEPIECSTVVEFGDPLAPGLGIGMIAVGPGCPIEHVSVVTAVDPLHTLRANGELACDGEDLLVLFTGDPAEGGNWLTGGNLDGWNPGTSYVHANTIDIIDFGIFYAEVQAGTSYPDGNTTCDMPGPHIDINGDGLVTMVDYYFIAMNFILQSDDPCNGDGAPPIVEIPVEDLDELGLGYLEVADLNFDGVLDYADMLEFEASQE